MKMTKLDSAIISMKVCPYEELGCIFKHETASTCKYRDTYKRTLCKFQHKVPENRNEQCTEECSICDQELISDVDFEKEKNAMIFNVLSVTNLFQLGRKLGRQYYSLTG